MTTPAAGGSASGPVARPAAPAGVARGGAAPAGVAGAAAGGSAGVAAGAGPAGTAAGAPARAGGSAGRPFARSGAAAAAKKVKPTRPPRLASLQLRRIDPWTTLKISLIVSIVMFFVWMVAVGVLYLSLDTLDVWNKLNETYTTLVVSPESSEAAGQLITPGAVFGVTAVVGAVNIVLFTALSAVFAFIYNAAAGMAGGIEVTLGERD